MSTSTPDSSGESAAAGVRGDAAADEAATAATSAAATSQALRKAAIPETICPRRIGISARVYIGRKEDFAGPKVLGGCGRHDGLAAAIPPVVQKDDLEGARDRN